MNRKRLARDESRLRTTQRLLDAAQKLIAKKGLSATSVEDMTAAAGYSRGAFYSNFKSKSDLFIELLRRDQNEMQREFEAIFADDVPVDEIQARTREVYRQMYRDAECFMYWAEARMLAARDPRFRAKLNALMNEKRDEIAGWIDYFYKRAGAAPPVSPAVLAVGFISLVEGVNLHMLSSPASITPEAAEAVLDLFMNSVMAMAR